MKRREFLGGAAASGAVLTMPAFLSGCGVNQATSVADKTPDNPFMQWFGVDQATTARVMSELSANGADAADLYFQHSRTNFLTLEDGIVSSANSDIQQGVGLRVVIGEQTGYAFTEDLTLASMLAAARTASAIASGSKAVAPQAFSALGAGDLYQTAVAWSDIGIDQKLPLMKYVESQAKSMDETVEKVAVYWADQDERVMIATLDGKLVTDHRPMTRVTLTVTARRGEEVQSGYSNIAAREEFAWYTEERLDTMVREAVDRTMVLFDARRPPAGEMPVILASGASGILLHEAIGHGMEADFNRKGDLHLLGDDRQARSAETFDHHRRRRHQQERCVAPSTYDDEGNLGQPHGAGGQRCPGKSYMHDTHLVPSTTVLAADGQRSPAQSLTAHASQCAACAIHVHGGSGPRQSKEDIIKSVKKRHHTAMNVSPTVRSRSVRAISRSMWQERAI